MYLSTWDGSCCRRPFQHSHSGLKLLQGCPHLLHHWETQVWTRGYTSEQVKTSTKHTGNVMEAHALVQAVVLQFQAPHAWDQFLVPSGMWGWLWTNTNKLISESHVTGRGQNGKVNHHPGWDPVQFLSEEASKMTIKKSGQNIYDSQQWGMK